MKIQRVTDDHRAKVYALLRRVYPARPETAVLVQRLHDHGKPLHEWVCLHTNRAVAYIAFSTAYRGEAACGLHLAFLVVVPELQKQGIGSELLRFALRQTAIAAEPLFVIGPPGFLQRFGFTPCPTVTTPLAAGKGALLALRQAPGEGFALGYDAEFTQKIKAAPAGGAPKRR